MEQLAGKVAVVTGAASGIGEALADLLREEDMTVVGVDVEGGDDVFRTDVSRAADMRSLADHVYERHGRVDILCNNAGVFAAGLMWERPASDFTWVLGVNLWGILHAVREFVPRMIAAGNDAHVVNTVSMAGLCTNAFTSPYTVSKFAALAATECLAHDLAAVRAPIKVSAVVPGAVNTGIARSSRNRPIELAREDTDDASFADQALHDLITTNGAPPAEVAAMIVAAIRAEEFLVPTRPSYTTQLQQRYEALAAKQLPPMPAFD